ncbi:hypothetical protein DFH06DRAFT_1136619 [Mycena polygramma]|nr:hypothetical protein DFH06DRAFT_1136619 [Mycena polygramma]
MSARTGNLKELCIGKCALAITNRNEAMDRSISGFPLLVVAPARAPIPMEQTRSLRGNDVPMAHQAHHYPQEELLVESDAQAQDGPRGQENDLLKSDSDSEGQNSGMRHTRAEESVKRGPRQIAGSRWAYWHAYTEGLRVISGEKSVWGALRRLLSRVIILSISLLSVVLQDRKLEVHTHPDSGVVSNLRRVAVTPGADRLKQAHD